MCAVSLSRPISHRDSYICYIYVGARSFSNDRDEFHRSQAFTWNILAVSRLRLLPSRDADVTASPRACFVLVDFRTGHPSRAHQPSVWPSDGSSLRMCTILHNKFMGWVYPVIFRPFVYKRRQEWSVNVTLTFLETWLLKVISGSVKLPVSKNTARIAY